MCAFDINIELWAENSMEEIKEKENENSLNLTEL